MTPRKLLWPLILVAAVARVWGLGFGLPYALARVDETAVAGPAVQFLSGVLRPSNFMYPTGLLYALALVYAGWYTITRPFGTYASLAAFAESRRQSLAPFFYLSRGLSALMGTLTVWGVFAICRHIFDDTVAIVATLFMALAFLHVRDSHFGTLDVSTWREFAGATGERAAAADALSARMQEAWTSFAGSGQPRDPVVGAWPARPSSHVPLGTDAATIGEDDVSRRIALWLGDVSA